MLNLARQILDLVRINVSPWMNELRISEIILDLYQHNARAEGSGINVHFLGRHYTLYLIEWKDMFKENRGGLWN